MTERERLLKAKIPCAKTGIEIKRTICDICSPGNHCGINAYVLNGKVIKIEGDEKHPQNRGLLCTKGLQNRAYIYRKDRILSPLRRVGERGSATFEPITWEQAYSEISERLALIKQEDGPEAVAFFSGYGKWYRPMLRRFAHSFGSPNYGSESSCCFTSGYMAWQTATGYAAAPDIQNTDLLIGWAMNSYYSNYLMPGRILNRKKEGMKVIVVDPKITPATEKLADLHLRPIPGTDGALALAMANELIQRGWVDYDFIGSYVHGFEEYSEYVSGFNGNTIEKMTGVPYRLVVRAVEMMKDSPSMAITESSAPLAHHKNGFQNYRAIMSLLALTGNYDVRGGQMPRVHTYTHVSSGFATREEEFTESVMPEGAPKAVGAERFPLWYFLEKEMQANALGRQIVEEKPYPIRAVFALGMNHRMFAGSHKMLEAVNKLEFFVDSDLFLTDTAKLADIVLPACSSFEREEFKTYVGGYAYYTKPAIDPLGESKSDVDILSDLANAMNLDDELLKSGYRKCIDYILSDNAFTAGDLRAADGPVRVPDFKPFEPGAALSAGLRTPSGKFELKSEIISAHPEWGLNALPTYAPPCEINESENFPFILSTGVRIPNAIHSRLHSVSWSRALRPDPLVEISLEDAAELKIANGDRVSVITKFGQLTLAAAPTATIRKGEAYMYHGYPNADPNTLLDSDNLDPYSGFPAFRSARCRIEKEPFLGN